MCASHAGLCAVSSHARPQIWCFHCPVTDLMVLMPDHRSHAPHARQYTRGEPTHFGSSTLEAARTHHSPHGPPTRATNSVAPLAGWAQPRCLPPCWRCPTGGSPGAASSSPTRTSPSPQRTRCWRRIWGSDPREWWPPLLRASTGTWCGGPPCCVLPQARGVVVPPGTLRV
jgi:hypothetical protein